MRTLFFSLVLMLAAGQAAGAPALYDMGTRESAVWPGFTRVTPEAAWSDAAGFGWEQTKGLRAVAKVHEAPVENKRRGGTDPPPMWTNAITEDAVIGEHEHTFLYTDGEGSHFMNPESYEQIVKVRIPGQIESGRAAALRVNWRCLSHCFGRCDRGHT